MTKNRNNLLGNKGNQRSGLRMLWALQAALLQFRDCFDTKINPYHQ